MTWTPRIVSDNIEPVRPIAMALRDVADDIDAHRHGNVTRIALVIEYDGGLTVEGIGEHICPYEMMGLFEAAKLMTFAEGME